MNHRLSTPNETSIRGLRTLLGALLVTFLFGSAGLLAQEEAKTTEDAATEEEEFTLPDDAELLIEPSEITVEVGETAQLMGKIMSGGEEVEGATVVYFSRARRSVGVNAVGILEAFKPGEFTVVALVPKNPEDRPGRGETLLRTQVKVTVPNPPVATVAINPLPGRLYEGTEVEISTLVTDSSGATRDDVEIKWASSDNKVASVNPFGLVELKSAGRATLTANAEDKAGSLNLRVRENTATQLKLRADQSEVRTGDVVRFEAVATDDRGRELADYPTRFSVSGTPTKDIIAAGAPAVVYKDGAFVAERSGIYTVVATGGNLSATHNLMVSPRGVTKSIEFVGQGKVRDRHTSDLWVWEGGDGRDYAITGTWGSEGHAYFWDVTNPENIEFIDAVKVDARTVNDVKVSEDGKIAVISREGASNRKNGLVLLDVSDPINGVRILSRFDDQLKGGVHNVFVHDDHVYAVNNGRKFDIINIEDPKEPYRVGVFELDTPGHSIHDVWVVDGVAFTSNWGDGIYAVDVGGGGMGGAPNNPVAMGSYQYPNGWNHAAFPYRSKSTGKYYVFGGDEAFPFGLTGRTPGEATPRASGWIHIVEWDDWNEPKEVARYQVPEAGTHNLWIEDDILYVGYYNGGLRMVDVSGELRGDLYRQGREIGFYLPLDPEGFIPNAPFTWGPQPFKDHVFVSDWNSGLWALKVVDAKKTHSQLHGESR